MPSMTSSETGHTRRQCHRAALFSRLLSCPPNPQVRKREQVYEEAAGQRLCRANANSTNLCRHEA